MDIQEERKAIFVGIIKQEDDESKVMEYLDELEFLAETAGLTGDRQFIQRVDKPEKATYIRSGKLEEIAQYCEENEIKYVIFDDELTGMQQRNIEKIVKTSIVIDRTSLILEIFSQRAKTAYAKMQVELARYNYMLPRLAGMWTHLERQRGGVGMRGGMGETQIEIDRRIVRERIARLKEQAGIHSEVVGHVLDAVAEIIHVDNDMEIYTSGATNIFKYPELSDKQSAQEIISAFEEKQQLADLVTETLASEENNGIQVYIGDETPVKTMKDCSVVTATYELGEGMKGTIGIIGPKRMDYEHVMKTLKTLQSELDAIYNKEPKE